MIQEYPNELKDEENFELFEMITTIKTKIENFRYIDRCIDVSKLSTDKQSEVDSFLENAYKQIINDDIPELYKLKTTIAEDACFSKRYEFAGKIANEMYGEAKSIENTEEGVDKIITAAALLSYSGEHERALEILKSVIELRKKKNNHWDEDSQIEKIANIYENAGEIAAITQISHVSNDKK